MPVQILVSAKPFTRAGKSSVGQIMGVQDLPDPFWGDSITTPNYTKFNIQDAEKTDIEPWLKFKKNEFSYEQTQASPSNERWRISTPTSLVQTYGQQAFPQDLVDYVVTEFGGTVFQSNIPQGQATFNFTPPVDIDFIKAELIDLFEIFLDRRRYRLSDAFVNQSLANNGLIEKTLAEINGAMQDTLV